MKKIYLLLFLLCSLLNKVNGQDFNYNDGQVATTLEIYNYITKGYPIQVASGLDMKNGYFLWEKSERKARGSDGVLRSVKINALIQAKDYKVCGWMLIYNREGGNDLYFCIPTQCSSEDVWDKAFGDLRDIKGTTDFYLAYSWALYNLVGSLTNDYDKICFRDNTLIRMANGTQKCIVNIKSGDTVLTIDHLTGKTTTDKVSSLITHADGNFKLMEIKLLNETTTIAGLNNITPIVTLEATNNHPILTEKGIKTIEELQLDDRVLYFNEGSNLVTSLPVISISTLNESVKSVYNIRLESNMCFFVNDLIALTK
jgi:hypothetical protein